MTWNGGGPDATEYKAIYVEKNAKGDKLRTAR